MTESRDERPEDRPDEIRADHHGEATESLPTPHDATGPVRLDATQEIGPLDEPRPEHVDADASQASDASGEHRLRDFWPAPSHEQPAHSVRPTGLDSEPTWAENPRDALHTPQTQPVPQVPAASTGRPDHIPAIPSAPSASPSPAYAAGPGQPPTPPHASGGSTTPPRRGPGWGAMLLVAGLCTLLAGLGGGLLGGWLAANGDMSFSRPVTPTGEGQTKAPTLGAGASTRPEGSIANIAATAMPSVVTIKVSVGGNGGTGSGWVLDTKGHIVTNNHVVANAANGGEITVVLSDGKQTKATIVGRDAPYDLAVLKVDRTDLKPLPVGESSKVVVGDQVIAVGAPLGLESTVTSGIVSALNRPVAAGDSQDTSFINAIQTDAAINPGNSGGPLLNMSGEVIGVNSAIATAPGTGAGNIGVGFAIPSDQVKKTVEQLIATGKAVHPVIGVHLDQAYTGEGVKVRTSLPNGQPPVNPDGPAAKAGIKPGDVIVALDGRPVSNPDALVVGIRSMDVGDKVTLTLRRDGKDQDVTMVLEGSQD